MLNAGLFSSQRHDWATPLDLFRDLDAEFGFDRDVCATATTAKCPEFFDGDELLSALAQPWEGVCFMNPPYGRQIGKWLEKAYSESLRGATVVCLIPSRTDTRWWHEYVMKASEIRFLRGRIYFETPEKRGRAPFPSAVVVFRG